MSLKLATAFRLALACLLLLYIFSRVPVSAVVAEISGSGLKLLLAAIATSLVKVLLAAWRLGILIGSYQGRLSVPLIARIKLVTRFYGVALPGSLSASVVHYHLLARERGRKAETLAAVAYGRLHFWFVTAALGAVSCLIEAQSSEVRQSVLAVLSALTLILAGALVLVHAPRLRLLRAAEKLSPRLAGILSTVASHVPRLSAQRKVLLAVAAVAENLAALLALFCLATAVHAEVGVVTLAWVRATMVFATILPLTPFGLGVREGGMILLLGPFGVGRATAVALSLLVLTSSLCLAGIGGVLVAQRLVRPPVPATREET